MALGGVAISMGERRPAISVVMASYNHAAYVGLAAESVLQQSFSDLALIIVDDGSRDDSRQILKEITDPRVKLIFQENRGPSAALNAGIAKARGRYIALMSSDDVSYPNRLDCQLKHLEAEGLDLVFALPHIIDDQGVIKDDSEGSIFFGKAFSSSSDLLRLFFDYGNFLCAPSALASSEIMRKVGPFRLGSLQFQDFDMWLRICKCGKVGLIADRLLQYRVHDANLSGKKGDIALRFEQQQIFRTFLDDTPLPLLRAAFPGMIAVDVESTPEEFEVEKSFVYLSHPDHLIRSIGAERLFAQIENPKTSELLATRWGFGPVEMHRLVRGLDVYNLTELHQLRHSLSTFLKKRAVVRLRAQ